MDMPDTITVRVSRARDTLARERPRLERLLAERGLTRRDQLIDSFRDADGVLSETDEFHDADELLALVEHLEQVLEGDG